MIATRSDALTFFFFLLRGRRRSEWWLAMGPTFSSSACASDNPDMLVRVVLRRFKLTIF